MHQLAHLVPVFFIATLMFQAGLQSTPGAIVKVLREGGLLGRALVLNFIIVPLVALGICRLLAVSPEVTTGILLMAIAPGVPFLPIAGGRAKGGHLALAVGLVFVFGLLSVVTAPLTANLILPAQEKIHLPVARFMTTLVLFQLIPLLLGILISRWNATLAERLERIVRVLLLVLLVVVLALIAVPVGRAIGAIFGSRGIVSIVLLIAISMLLGWFSGGPDSGSRVTVSIGSGLRNPGLAVLVATSNFAGTLVVPTVLAFLLVQVIMGVLAGTYIKRKLESERVGGPPLAGDVHAPAKP